MKTGATHSRNVSIRQRRYRRFAAVKLVDGGRRQPAGSRWASLSDSVGFFAELRRRNVLRAGALYAASTWALAQGVAQLGPSFGAPDWVARWFVIACIIGAPFWLAFAWFYEFTPEGLKRESEIAATDSIAHHTGRKLDRWIFAIMGVAIVLLLTDRFVLRHGVNQTIEASEHSIAVLPFVNRSPDKDQEFFSDGISEDMLNLLAKVRELKVISRSSSFSFKGKDVPLKQIAATLGVAYILEGSVQRAGKMLRISAQLIDARSDDNVWSESYDRPFDDVFAIQDDIAGTVVRQLKLTLLGKAKEIDPEAYALFLQAREQARLHTSASQAQAIQMLKQVLAKAPSYAPAWTRLAQVYEIEASNGGVPVAEGFPLARDAVNKAIAVDPDYGPAYASLGYLDTVTNDLAAAAQHFERALSLDPQDPVILSGASLLAETLGRVDLAIALANAAIALDPLGIGSYSNRGNYFLEARRWDEAIASYRMVLGRSPGFISAQANLGIALLHKGDAQAALTEALKEHDESYRMVALAIVYHALGRSTDSDAALAELIARHEKEVAFNIAYVYAYRGEADQAFEWLDKAQVYKDPGLSIIAVEPLFDNIRKDPRWLPLLRKLGQDPETLGKIEFNVTLPTAGAKA